MADSISKDILVLCADPDLSARVKHWLNQAGVQAVQAFDGYNASHVINHHGAAAIITDRLLPPWPGFETFTALRKSRSGIAIIYVGNGSTDSANFACAAGATHVLPFPLRRQAVLDVLTYIVVKDDHE